MLKELPFRQGDVVRLVKDTGRSWKVGQIHIINEYNINIGAYSTNRGAWINHDQFELVEPASLESYKKLIKDFGEEDGA